MRSVLSLLVLGSLIISACGEKRSSESTTRESPKNKAPAPGATAPPAKKSRIDFSSLTEDKCPALAKILLSKATAEAECVSDSQCAIRPIDLCNIRGLGCYWIAHNKERAPKPVNDAIVAYQSGCMRMGKCDCASTPTSAVCRSGRCVAKPR